MSSISFTVRPPPSGSGYRPSPLGNGSRHGAPSRRLFEQGDDEEDEGHGTSSRRVRDERIDGMANGRSTGYVLKALSFMTVLTSVERNQLDHWSFQLYPIETGDNPQDVLYPSTDQILNKEPMMTSKHMRGQVMDLNDQVFVV